MSQPITVVGLAGSLRGKSYTRMAVNLALAGAKEAGAETELLDLRNYELAFCDGNEDESAYPEGVFRLRKDIAQAKGVILGTPEYHAGVSGVLKNALDLMGFEEFEGKMVGLVGVSGGSAGAANALNSLRLIGRSLHAWVVPDQVSIPRAWQVFDEDGTLNNARMAARLADLGQQVVRFASLHEAGNDPEFLDLWETAPENPGG